MSAIFLSDCSEVTAFMKDFTLPRPAFGGGEISLALLFKGEVLGLLWHNTPDTTHHVEHLQFL